MPTFKDANDREWTIRLDAPTVLRIRAATCDRERCRHLQGSGCTGIDLVDMSGDTQAQLHRDVVLLVNVLYLLCEPEAKQRGVTDEQFGAALVGDAIYHATTAMDEAIAFFFPEQTRKILTAVTAKEDQVKTLGMKMALEKINDPKLVEDVMAAVESNIDAALKSLLTPANSATSSQES